MTVLRDPSDDDRWQCFYCRTVGHGTLPQECTTCTVELTVFVGLFDTYGKIIDRFINRYHFHPGELFPWLSTVRSEAFIRSSMIDYMDRHMLSLIDRTILQLGDNANAFMKEITTP